MRPSDKRDKSSFSSAVKHYTQYIVIFLNKTPIYCIYKQVIHNSHVNKLRKYFVNY